jgi:tRNA modification GTPase
MSSGDTIAALATPPGEGALAVIRISGPDTKDLFPTLGWKQPSPPPHRLLQRGLYRATSGELLDDLTWIPYASPRSFTGEDMVELITHGSPFIVERILQDLTSRGLRLAEPGEFTRIAFLNRKLDLAQAEAIVDLIRARSDRALLAAQKQLSGALGQQLDHFITRLLRVTAQIEAYIDFPEEDLPPEDQSGPHRDLADLIQSIERLAATQKYRERLQDGIKIVILGQPNAGKSTLLNALVGEDRAIVSEEPGTTRDYIDVRTTLGPHLIRLIDTAGIRETESLVEKAGVERTRRLATEADVLLLVVDRHAPPPAVDGDFADLFKKRPTLLVSNKADLPADPEHSRFLPNLSPLPVSARDGKGLETLHDKLLGLLNSEYHIPEDADVIVSARHAGSLVEARSFISQAKQILEEAGPVELAASELHLAIEALGRITGKIDNERMLDELFGSFCIGK